MLSGVKRFIKTIFQKVKYKNSIIEFGSIISMDSKIAHGVKILSGSKIGACTIGKNTYVGNNCSIERTTIGSFVSIGPEVLCGLGSHPLNFISTYPGFYTKYSSGANWFGALHTFNDKKKVIIGSDVWIGARAIIIGGITIGNGSVVAAGSIVTKDVPNYAIVGGIPAKVIKFRFPDAFINELLISKWWDSDDLLLKKYAYLAHKPSDFILKLKNEKK